MDVRFCCQASHTDTRRPLTAPGADRLRTGVLPPLERKTGAEPLVGGPTAA
ncbi:hypothetical protein [Streptomyces gobitricini]|uniref:hypothetical protein n=1 Tax=Streptomyces gobitricini TaxID=68211 RepID=UPI0031E0D8E5